MLYYTATKHFHNLSQVLLKITELANPDLITKTNFDNVKHVFKQIRVDNRALKLCPVAVRRPCVTELDGVSYF